MGNRMAGATMARRCHCVGTEAAERESQNENPARRPAQRIGSRRFR
jgi:hypothetical protein